jgi:hypothetical protein
MADTQLSTIGPAPATPDMDVAQNTPEASSAAPAATPPAPAVPPAGRERAPAPPDGDRQSTAYRLEGISRHEARLRRRDQEAQQRDHGFAEREAKLAAREKELEAALEDPVKYYLDKGKDPVEVAKRFAKPETEEQKRIRMLEEREQEREERSARERQEREKEEDASRRHETLRTFVSSITPDNCPTLVVEYEAHEVPVLLQEVLERPASRPRDVDTRRAYDLFREEYGRTPTSLELFRSLHRRYPTEPELREALELEAQSRATSRESRRAGYNPPPQQASAEPTAAGPESISNQHAPGTNGAAPKKASLEERRRRARDEMIRELEGEGAEG